MKRKEDKEKRYTFSLEKKHTYVFGQSSKVHIALVWFTLRINNKDKNAVTKFRGKCDFFRSSEDLLVILVMFHSNINILSETEISSEDIQIAQIFIHIKIYKMNEGIALIIWTWEMFQWIFRILSSRPLCPLCLGPFLTRLHCWWIIVHISCSHNARHLSSIKYGKS